MPTRPMPGRDALPCPLATPRARRACSGAVAAALATALFGLAGAASAQAPLPGPAPMPGQPAAPFAGPVPASALGAPPFGAPGYLGPPLALPIWANPTTIEYEEGDPILPGYQLVTRPHRALFAAGLSTFLASYGLTFVISSIALTSDDANEDFGPLLIPIFGPIITMSVADTAGAGTFWLAVDSAVQTGGLLLLAASLAHEEMYLRRQISRGGHGAAQAASLAPEVSVGPASATFRWRF
jgi:hypothetical protein